jgi:hypothetical protein
MRAPAKMGRVVTIVFGAVAVTAALCWWLLEGQFRWALADLIERGKLQAPLVVLGGNSELTPQEWLTIHNAASDATGPFKVDILSGNSIDGYLVRITNRFGSSEGGIMPFAKRPIQKPFLIHGGLVHFSMSVSGLKLNGSDPKTRAIRLEAYRRIVGPQLSEWSKGGIESMTVERMGQPVAPNDYEENILEGVEFYADQATLSFSEIALAADRVMAEAND